MAKVEKAREVDPNSQQLVRRGGLDAIIKGKTGPLVITGESE